MLRRTFPALALAAALAAHPALAGQAAAPVLVELFTSEGCSSCPPADRLLGELAARDDVLPLAFHVTYWDPLGWPDPFATAAGTERQRAYAARLGPWTAGEGRPYTPQAVVGGRLDVLGSDERRLFAAVDLVRERGGPVAAVTFAGAGEEASAALPALPLERPAELWTAAFDAHHRVAVARGENAGRDLDHHNVVRELAGLGPWDGTARSVPLPVGRLRREGRSGVAVVAQDAVAGRVVAIGRLDL